MYEHVIRAAARTPWAILPEKLAEIQALLELKAAGHSVDFAAAAAPSPSRQANGQIAVLPLYGVVAPKMNLMSEMSGGTSLEQFTQAFRQAMADPSVIGILIDVDSPGGSVQGLEELSSEIRAARGQKAIASIANHLEASAAYMIGCSVGEMAVTPSGEVGSIGVLAMHVDMSAKNEMDGVKPTLVTAGKYKAETSDIMPLSEEAHAEIQKQVDYYYGLFVNAVAVGRGVSANVVRDGFGQGRVVNARDAVALGMVDRIATFDQMISRLSSAQIRANMVKRGATADYLPPVFVGALPSPETMAMQPATTTVASGDGTQVYLDASGVEIPATPDEQSPEADLPGDPGEAEARQRRLAVI